jgi:ATP-binding cassette, subfamily F, member 3
VVSHDRAFLSNVVDRLVYVADGSAVVIPGGYDRFLEFRAKMATERTMESETEKPPPSKQDAKKRKRKFPYRKIEEIEADVADREARIQQSEALLVSPDVYKDGRRVKEVQDQLVELRNDLARLYEHWEEASELNS